MARKIDMSGRSAFFYGTLMAAQVLHRVCHGSSSPDNPLYSTHNLQPYPAILHNYRRQRVQFADYPAIVPHSGSTVRGIFVTGLTDADIWRLDLFEGDEYERQVVKARILTTIGDEEGTGNVEGDEVEAETYVWISGAARLEEKQWSLGEFQREKMRFWVGPGGDGEYAEVDEAVAAQQQDGTGGRGANGHISKALQEEHGKEDMSVVKSVI